LGQASRGFIGRRAKAAAAAAPPPTNIAAVASKATAIAMTRT
jgi:hypothetical protein